MFCVYFIRRLVPLRHIVGAGGIHHQRNASLLADLRHRWAFVPAERAIMICTFS